MAFTVQFVIGMWVAFQGVLSQNEICSFYGLQADCWYRIDGISLSRIQVIIDQCSDPIQVTFHITNERPKVDETYSFSGEDTLVSVPFYIQTQLRVRITYKPDRVINVEADFHVYGMAKADFINDDVKLWGLDEQCPGLNTAEKIAVGVMGGLAGVAAVMIFILLIIRYRRSKKMAGQARNNLVINMAEVGTSSPGTSMINIHDGSHVTYAIQNTPGRTDENGHVTQRDENVTSCGINECSLVTNTNHDPPQIHYQARENDQNSPNWREESYVSLRDSSGQCTDRDDQFSTHGDKRGQFSTQSQNCSVHDGHVAEERTCCIVQENSVRNGNMSDKNETTSKTDDNCVHKIEDSYSDERSLLERQPETEDVNHSSVEVHQADSRHKPDVRFSELLRKGNVRISSC